MKYALECPPPNKSKKRGKKKIKNFTLQRSYRSDFYRDDLTGRPSTDDTGIPSAHREITHI